MRNIREIQAAHDRLIAILVGEIPNPSATLGIRDFDIAAGVLCWVLRHDHNLAFGMLLKRIDDFMAERGYELREGRPS